MLNSWFSSKSSRHRKTPSSSPPASSHVQSGPSDTSSVSQSTVGPAQSPGNLTLTSDVQLEAVHAHINDPSVYAPTPSLIHSTEKEAATLRMSDVPPSLDAATHRPRTSTSEHQGETLFTPQDAIVAHVFGKSAPPPATDSGGQAGDTPPPSQPPASLMTRTSDLATSPTLPDPRPTLPIYDPFSGAKLGEHTPIPISPSTATPSASASETAGAAPAPDDRKLWSSLERILELQAEIAAMHADMEGVGRGAGSLAHAHAGGGVRPAGGTKAARRRSRRGQTLPVGDEEPEEHGPVGGTAGVAASEASTEHSDGEEEDEDDEDGDGDGVHRYGKRRRDEGFARLAEQFAQRKAAIGGIMNKLDALSIALKTFHTLPPPLFDLAACPARTDTMSSAASNVSAPSPPLHVYSGPSSPPPLISLSPPVPPISTLAPLGDPSAPLGLTPIVAPILPQIVLPTIILGAPHVESPADMDHAQSIFRRMP